MIRGDATGVRVVLLFGNTDIETNAVVAAAGDPGQLKGEASLASAHVRKPIRLLQPRSVCLPQAEAREEEVEPRDCNTLAGRGDVGQRIEGQRRAIESRGYSHPQVMAGCSHDVRLDQAPGEKAPQRDPLR